MRDWTPASARRFLDALEASLAGDLPLFAAGGGSPPPGEFRLQRVGSPTLSFLEKLVRTAAARRGVRPIESPRRRGLVAVAVPGGPALLAVREGGGRWRALLALEGGILREAA